MIHRIVDGQKYRFGFNLGPKPSYWISLYLPPLVTIRYARGWGLEAFRIF